MKKKEYQIEWLYIPFAFVVIWILLFLFTTATLAKVKNCNEKKEEERNNDPLCVMLKDF